MEKLHSGTVLVHLDAYRTPDDLAAVTQRRFRLAFSRAIERTTPGTDNVTSSTTTWTVLDPLVAVAATAGPRAFGQQVAFGLSTVPLDQRHDRLDQWHRAAPNGWSLESLEAARQTLASIAEVELSA